jgi:enoyl-CoA hydratase
MNYKNILVEQAEGIALVKVNRPQAMNALNQEVLLELFSAFKELDQDDKVGVVILSGEGKAFVAGADIKEMLSMNAIEARKFGETGHVLMNFMGQMEKPIVAAVNGFALGGGMELALACDFIYAAENAKFGQPEINLGIIPGFGGTQRLSRQIGRAQAKELIFTGGIMSAQEAKEIGIVNKVFPPETLLSEVKKVAALIASKGALSLRLAKSAIDTGYNVDLKSGCSIERDSFALCFSHQDQKEGMSAFLEKRKPAFTSK